MGSPEPVWRTAQEIALLCGVQARTVRMWGRRGRVTVVDGRYDLAQVIDWWDNHRNHRMDRATCRAQIV